MSLGRPPLAVENPVSQRHSVPACQSHSIHASSECKSPPNRDGKVNLYTVDATPHTAGFGARGATDRAGSKSPFLPAPARSACCVSRGYLLVLLTLSSVVSVVALLIITMWEK